MRFSFKKKKNSVVIKLFISRCMDVTHNSKFTSSYVS